MRMALRLIIRFRRTWLEQKLAEATLMELGEWNGKGFFNGAIARLSQVSVTLRRVR